MFSIKSYGFEIIMRFLCCVISQHENHWTDLDQILWSPYTNVLKIYKQSQSENSRIVMLCTNLLTCILDATGSKLGLLEQQASSPCTEKGSFNINLLNAKYVNRRYHNIILTSATHNISILCCVSMFMLSLKSNETHVIAWDCPEYP
jgi:hypothetical protein